ncbi:MAG: hypothetical protein J0L82_09925 [Deltaproteobacteria bacterium]|jgi:hypothetical protein|nr:hypothetical protein [Deltaproteobacteria bacterium]
MTSRQFLLFQAVVLWTLFFLLPKELKYFSAFSLDSAEVLSALATIPVFLLASSVLPIKVRHWLYLLGPFIFVQSLYSLIAGFLILAVAFFVAQLKPQARWLTALLILILIPLLFWANRSFYIDKSAPFAWLVLMIHTSWGIKLFAWIVSVRVYGRSYSLDQFVEFFFHPAFFMFTNDLNVLTPSRFFSGKMNEIKTHNKTVATFTFGLTLLVAYGFLQTAYFKNLSAFEFVGSSVVGGILSVATAIIFHAANVMVQISFLSCSGFQISLDMNAPWRATSPGDYWKRMHFYVREFILEILVKPLMTAAFRRNSGLIWGRLIVLMAIFSAFTLTQIGFQPYRNDRSTAVGLVITGIFFCMTVLPEIIPRGFRNWAFGDGSVRSRVLTFLILIAGYSVIFSIRSGF